MSVTHLDGDLEFGKSGKSPVSKTSHIMGRIRGCVG